MNKMYVDFMFSTAAIMFHSNILNIIILKLVRSSIYWE